MSEAPPPKKMKQTDTMNLSLTPISRNHVAEETSQASDIVQKEMDPSNQIKIEETPLTTDLQQRTDRTSHTFRFCYENRTYAASCDTSQMVLDALNTSQAFEQLHKKNKQKELVIKRQKEAWEITGAALKSDFPCCLIQKDEILNIDFIQNRENKKLDQEQMGRENLSLSGDPENLVTFNIKTRGGGDLKRIMKNMQLPLEVEEVCVYAFKEETLKTALSRDGRFIEEIFKRNCVLLDLATNTMYELSNCVGYINRKHFQLNVMSNYQPDGQENKSTIKTKCNVALKEGTDPNPLSSLENKGKQTKTMQSKSPTITCTTIPDSQEIAQILCHQYEAVLYPLQEQMNKSEIQEFFKAEYDKSNQSFSEVKKVKKLMSLSDSVCQIRVEGSPRGTGFLLFNRFILTNAHVFGVFNLTTFNPAGFTAVFGYEDLDQNGKRIPIKNLTCYFYGKDDKGNHLDYALLELQSVNEIVGYPELFRRYRQNSPDNRSQICIVGHPDSGVKKMDPCFIIGKENRQEAENKHTTENAQFHHVMSQRALEEKWDFHTNQITYDSCFFFGSSGSPIFDIDCKLIGVHTGGYVYLEGDKTKSVMEYAYLMEPILAHIKAQARIKGIKEILDILEGNSTGINQSSTTEQLNQTDNEEENEDDLSPI